MIGETSSVVKGLLQYSEKPMRIAFFKPNSLLMVSKVSICSGLSRLTKLDLTMFFARIHLNTYQKTYKTVIAVIAIIHIQEVKTEESAIKVSRLCMMKFSLYGIRSVLIPEPASPIFRSGRGNRYLKKGKGMI